MPDTKPTAPPRPPERPAPQAHTTKPDKTRDAPVVITDFASI